jgi:Peptidase family M23
MGAIMKWKLWTGTTLVVGWIMAATATFAQELAVTPLVVDVLSAPTPVRGSDLKYHLVYELRLANHSSTALSIDKVEVFKNSDPVQLVPLLALERDAIAGRLSIGGRRGAEAPYLAMGQFAVLFVHVPVDELSPPASITHRFTVRLLQSDRELKMVAGQSAVHKPTTLTLAPPLKGPSYFAGNGCCDTTVHVRALLPLNGRVALAQRFAIDWLRVGKDGRFIKDANSPYEDVKSHNIYGDKVYAVANGTVVARRDDLPNQVPGKLPDNIRIEDVDGNFIVLKIGDNGPYAFFAHLQKTGVASLGPVKAGEVIGYVGNSGNTSAPHLHFHVMDGAGPLTSNGLPYAIDQFRLTGMAVGGAAEVERAAERGAPLDLKVFDRPEELKVLLPMDMTVNEFR